MSLLNEIISSTLALQWARVLATPIALVFIANFINSRLAKNERKINERNNKKESLKSYLATMTNLLIEHELAKTKHDSSLSQAARAITIAVLKEADHSDRVQIIEFLHDSKLIQKTSLTDTRPTIFRGVNFEGLDLHGINFGDVDFTNANLSHTNLKRAYLGNAELANANLNQANLGEAWFGKANLNCAYLYKSKLDKAILQSANMKNSHFDQASLKGASLNLADLSDAEFGYTISEEILASKIESIVFKEIGIKRAIKFRLILALEIFKRWRFKGANLAGAKLDRSIVKNTNFKCCNLSHAKLMGSDFSGCNLEKVNLYKASLVGTSLEGAAIDGAYFKNALYDETTLFPEDFCPVTNKMKNK